jgi:hypothetical protein
MQWRSAGKLGPTFFTVGYKEGREDGIRAALWLLPGSGLLIERERELVGFESNAVTG